MKRTLLLLIAICGIFYSRADNYRVLFIGNSYTYVNNLPQVISSMAESTNDTLTFTMHAPGGCTFAQHVQSAAQYIRQGGWDYVVLQEQSQLPSFPDGQFMSQSYPYAQQLCDSIRTYNPNAKIVFYMTWGRKNGDQQNCPVYPPLCTYQGMDSLIYVRYMMMAEDNEAMVSPVGYVWHVIRDQYAGIELYESDESHPSLAGTYAAACSFYATFFQKSPNSISFDAGLNSQEAANIRQIATTLVFDSLDKWSFLIPADTSSIDTTSGDSVSVAGYAWQPILVYPNPASNEINLLFADDQALPVAVMLYNGKGDFVAKYSVSDHQTTIPTQNLPSGVYYVLPIKGKTRYPVQKILISRP